MYYANRGTFGNIRLVNKFLGKAAPKTVHIPSGMTLDVFDAAQAEYYHSFKEEGNRIIIAVMVDVITVQNKSVP